MKSDRYPEIGIVYFENIFCSEDIEAIKLEAQKMGISIDTKEQKNTIWACLDFFVPVVQFFLSPAIIESLFFIVASSAVWDGLKLTISRVIETITEKKIHKVTTNKISEMESVTYIVAGNIKAVFPTDTNSEIVNHCIDKFFEYLEHRDKTKVIYVLYDAKNDKMIEYTEDELIDKVIAEQQQKNSMP